MLCNNDNKMMNIEKKRLVRNFCNQTKRIFSN